MIYPLILGPVDNYFIIIMQFNPFTIILEEAFMLTPQVKHFVFRVEHTSVFNYLPGQFITIHFDYQGKMLKRSYSIANVPLHDNCIELAAGYVEGGPGTDLLFNLKTGDTVNMTGPFGRLILKNEVPKRYIFVATSTGITPYRAMLDELKHRLQSNPELEIVILEGVQKQEDVLYADDFTRFAAEFPRVAFHVHLSRETPEKLKAHERLGYVQQAFPHLSINPQNDFVYLCGNPSMIDDAFNDLKEMGLNTQHIIREKYISAPTRDTPQPG